MTFTKAVSKSNERLVVPGCSVSKTSSDVGLPRGIAGVKNIRSGETKVSFGITFLKRRIRNGSDF